jgi:hypothetical protein
LAELLEWLTIASFYQPKLFGRASRVGIFAEYTDA